MGSGTRDTRALNTSTTRLKLRSYSHDTETLLRGHPLTCGLAINLHTAKYTYFDRFSHCAHYVPAGAAAKNIGDYVPRDVRKGESKCSDRFTLVQKKEICQSLRRGLALRPRPSRPLPFLGPDGGGLTKA